MNRKSEPEKAKVLETAPLDVNNNLTEVIRQTDKQVVVPGLNIEKYLSRLCLDTPDCRNAIHELDENNNEVDVDSQLTVVGAVETEGDVYKHINFEPCQQCPGSVLFQNDMFTLNFDIGTPRPHFIILFKRNGWTKRQSIKDLTDKELASMLGLCEQFIVSINAQSEQFTLAFHTGNWATARNFHGHLCCDTALYLRILSAKQLEAKYLVRSKNWHGPDYVQNVLDYEILQEAASRVYKLKSLDAIAAEADKPTQPPGYQLPFVNKRHVELLYDTNEPHLEFKLTEEVKAKWAVPKQRLQLLKTLVDWSHKQGFFGRDRGSHLCLNMYPQQKAYVRMDGHVFFKMHPQSELFLARFSDLSQQCYIRT